MVGQKTGKLVKKLITTPHLQRFSTNYSTGVWHASLPNKLSTQVNRPEKSIFSNKDWDIFFHLTDNSPKPTRDLREAYRTYKEQFDSEE